MTRDFVPNKDQDFHLYQANMLAIVQINLTAWGISQADFTALVVLQASWTTIFAKASNKLNRTAADVQAKDDARKVYEKALRNFIGQWLAKNAKVPDSERERMGLTVIDTKHTLARVPESRPIGRVDFSVRLQHTIHFTDENSPRSKAKPKGVHGCEIWMKMDGTTPKDAAELTYLATDTRTPYVVHFAGVDAGKIVYYWLRWINSTGKPGIWSATINAMIVA